MNASLNFQDRYFRLSRYITLALAAVLTVAFAAFILALVRLTLLQSEVDSVRSDLDSLQVAEGQVGTADILQVRHQAIQLKKLVQHDGKPASRILRLLGDALPSDVRLARLDYDGRQGVAAFTAESADMGSLGEFVRRLEQTPGVARVVVLQQESARAESRYSTYEVLMTAVE